MNATKTNGIRLTAGTQYDVDSLTLVGWSTGADCIDGYSYLDYFRDGRYLGADQDGIEPMFADAGA